MCDIAPATSKDLFVCRQVRPSREEILPTAVEFTSFMDNNVQVSTDVKQLPGICADRVFDSKRSYAGG